MYIYSGSSSSSSSSSSRKLFLAFVIFRSFSDLDNCYEICSNLVLPF